MGQNKVRVFITDDNEIFREGLCSVFDNETDIQVCGEAGSAEEAVPKILKLLPDVVLMDIQLPKANGIEATAEICSKSPEIKVVMLTVSESDEDLFEAIRVGAMGYLVKNTEPKAIRDAVRVVHTNGTVISPALAVRLLEELNALWAQEKEEVEAWKIEELTDREHQVLTRIVKGMTNAEIAADMFLSERTIKGHVSSAILKLQAKNRVNAAIKYANRIGISE